MEFLYNASMQCDDDERINFFNLDKFFVPHVGATLLTQWCAPLTLSQCPSPLPLPLPPTQLSESQSAFMPLSNYWLNISASSVGIIIFNHFYIYFYTFLTQIAEEKLLKSLYNKQKTSYKPN